VTPLRTTFAVLLVAAAVLLAAGCTGQNREYRGNLCGGGFEVYEFPEGIIPNGTSIVLTEKDFSDFPKLGAVIRGEKRTKASCSRISDRYPFCIGGAGFECNEESLVGNYEDHGSEPGDIAGLHVKKYLIYEGKSYYLKIVITA